MTLDGLTLSLLIEELNETLLGNRVQKIYHPKPNYLTLNLWSPVDRQERTLLIDFGEPPQFHITHAPIENPLSPSSFCMLLRKHLKNGFIESIRQDGLERLVDIGVCRPDRRYLLRVELLGRRGNLFLLKPQMDRASSSRVLGAAIHYPSRELRPGTRYSPPAKQHKLNPLTAEQDDFLTLGREDFPLWRWLLDHLAGIGPRLAKELVLRTGFDLKCEATQLENEDVNALWASVRQMFASRDQAENEPHVYFKDGQPVDAVPFPLKLYNGLERTSVSTLSEAFDACLQEELPASEDSAERARLLKHLRVQIKKTQTALDHVAADLHRAAQYDQIKLEADLIMMNLSTLEQGADAVNLVEPESGQSVTVTLDPRLTPVEAAQKRYTRYKKLKRGVDKLEQRQAQIRLELEYFQTVQVQAEQAESSEDLEALAEELGLSKPLDPRHKRAEPSGPRKFEVDGYTILVGRNSRQNDALTRRAHPEDFWLHARQRPGSHVVLKTNGKPDAVPEAVRLRAAQLAAYYSKGRGATKVPVICTRAKYLRKPKGAKPGLVLVGKEEHTLLVAPTNEESS